MKRESEQFGTLRATSSADTNSGIDERSVWNRSELGIEESGEVDEQVPASYGGLFRDIAGLKSVVDTLRQMKEEETEHFIARWLTVLFFVWTIIGLLAFILTGNPWILATGLGPGVLYRLVVYHYFDRERRRGSRRE